MITHFGYFCLLVYVAGQTHLNSDAKIADEGRPQGGRLPIAFALGRAPTRGAPTDCLCPGKGTHKGRPYRLRFALGSPTRGAPDCGGHPQGGRLPIVYALGRAPTRGAPTDCVLPWGGHPQGAPLPIAFCPGEGTHKGRPYRLRFALGRAPTRGAPTDCVLPWGGHPQGGPLPIAFALPHKGRP